MTGSATISRPTTVRWGTALAVPGGLDLVMDGFPVTPQVAEEFEAAYASYVGALSHAGFRPKELEPLARAGLALMRLRREANGDLAAQFRRLAGQIADDLRPIHANGLSRFARPREVSAQVSRALARRTQPVPRLRYQVPKILDPIRHVIEALDVQRADLNKFAQRIRARVVRLEGVVASRTFLNSGWFAAEPKGNLRAEKTKLKALLARLEEMGWVKQKLIWLQQQIQQQIQGSGQEPLALTAWVILNSETFQNLPKNLKGPLAMELRSLAATVGTN